MSFLDLDERLIQIAEKASLVYSPLVDIKTFPDWVDLTLVEGAVSNMEDWEKIRNVRQHTHTLVSLGDCAITGNVPSMRNQFSANAVLERSYHENIELYPQIPRDMVPHLLARVRPVHEVVKVDVFIPGCPPPADAIFFALSELLEGRTPDLSAYTRFGS
ncbi:MAG: NADP oxidoreductase [Chloroflexaceae bacterium]|nr:NADP oxidoreductase [Chloroflexaceae bacterium]